MKAQLIKTHRETSDITTYFFKTNKKLRYTAGQFVELRLNMTADIDQDQRWFTLSSSPTEDHISITTRHHTNQSIFKNNLQNLRSDHEINVSQAMGDFVLPKDKRIQLMFIAFGIGVTPIRSMVQYMKDTNQDRNLQLLYFVKDISDECFHELLSSSIPELRIITTSSTPPDLSSMFDTISATIPTSEKPLIYLSGPEPVVEFMYKKLLENGIQDARLRTDFFPGYQS